MSDVTEALKDVPGVLRLWKRGELYSGSLLASSPDIWVEAEPDVEIRALFDEEWVTKRPERGEEWIVNHRADGIFGFLGKNVASVDCDRASIYDMCPTILSFFGISPSPSVDGTALPIVSGLSRGDTHSDPDVEADA